MRKIFVSLFIFIAFISFGQSLEIPKDATANVFEYTGFVLSYSEEHEQAEWVAYELTAEEAQGEEERTDYFKEDPRITTGTATIEDYRGSGYDRGHLAPAGDMAWSKESMADSFYFSNMSPQVPSFNRGEWRILESLIREWAIEYSELYVVTGPVLTGGIFETIGPNEVSVPDWYYKVVLRRDGDSYKSIGFLLPNKDIEDFVIEHYVFPVNFIEMILKIDFFHLLDDDIEELVENDYNLEDWK